MDVTPRLQMSGVNRVISFMREGVEKGFNSLEEVSEAIRNYQPHRKRDQPQTTESLESLKKNIVFNEESKKWVFHWDPKVLDTWVDDDRTPKDLEEYGRRVEQDAAKIKCPVLLLKGRFTDIVADDGVFALKQVIPQALVQTVQDAAHMIAGDQNDIFTASLVTFANSIRGRMEYSSLALVSGNVSSSTSKTSTSSKL